MYIFYRYELFFLARLHAGLNMTRQQAFPYLLFLPDTMACITKLITVHIIKNTRHSRIKLPSFANSSVITIAMANDGPSSKYVFLRFPFFKSAYTGLVFGRDDEGHCIPRAGGFQ